MSNAVIKLRTYREAVRFTLEWTIENFTSFRNEADAMYGPGITMAELGMKDDYEGRWHVYVVPCFERTVDEIEKKCFSVYLELSDTGNESHTDEEPNEKSGTEKESDKESAKESDTVTESHEESDKESETDKNLDMGKKTTSSASEQKVLAEFSARITTGKTTQKVIFCPRKPAVHTYTSDEDDWGWRDAISHDDLFGSDEKTALLKDDCITVSLDVVVYKQPQSIQSSKTVVLSTAQQHQNFATRQLSWFGSHQQCQSRDLDFTLRSSDGKEFRTSRWILMAHSPVFAAMLKYDSEETKSSRCEMFDIDGETTEVMLSYMYGCSMEKVNKVNADKVLIMADKYQMMDLLHACEELLASNVTIDQAVHLLVMASQRGLEKLKVAALDVIPKNMASVLKNGALEEALQADPYLLQTIMEHCSKRMRDIDDS